MVSLRISQRVHSFLTRVFALSLSVLVRVACGTNRLSATGLDIYERHVDQGNNIFAFWHSRLFYLAYYYVRTANRKVSALVSLSRDGDYATALLKRLGQDVVRGSTSRGGQAAVRRLAEKAAEGNNIAITPDGPRGPARKVNEGVIRLAQLTGARIIPASYDATRKAVLKSWDGFIIVKPFGRVHIAVGEPIEVSRDMTAEQIEQARQQLEQRLLELDRVSAGGLNHGGGA